MTARQGEIKFAAPAECVSASFCKNAKRRLFSVFKDYYLSIALLRHLTFKNILLMFLQNFRHRNRTDVNFISLGFEKMNLVRFNQAINHTTAESEKIRRNLCRKHFGGTQPTINCFVINSRGRNQNFFFGNDRDIYFARDFHLIFV